MNNLKNITIIGLLIYNCAVYGQLKFADILASKDKEINLKYGDSEKLVAVKKGETYRFDGNR